MCGCVLGVGVASMDDHEANILCAKQTDYSLILLIKMIFIRLAQRILIQHNAYANDKFLLMLRAWHRVVYG